MPSFRPASSPKSTPGKCHVLPWGFPRKLSAMKASGGNAAARLASEPRSEAGCRIPN